MREFPNLLYMYIYACKKGKKIDNWIKQDIILGCAAPKIEIKWDDQS